MRWEMGKTKINKNNSISVFSNKKMSILNKLTSSNNFLI